jgi:hypothetical protein
MAQHERNVLNFHSFARRLGFPLLVPLTHLRRHGTMSAMLQKKGTDECGFRLIATAYLYFSANSNVWR